MVYMVHIYIHITCGRNRMTNTIFFALYCSFDALLSLVDKMTLHKNNNNNNYFHRRIFDYDKSYSSLILTTIIFV